MSLGVGKAGGVRVRERDCWIVLFNGEAAKGPTGDCLNFVDALDPEKTFLSPEIDRMTVSHFVE